MRARALTRPFSLRRLTRSSQIGEFYVMQPPQIQPEGANNKFTADMMIYDEESDRHVRIPWWEALAASGAGELMASGSNGAKTLTGPTADNTLTDWVREACIIAAYSSGMFINVSSTGKITATTTGTATASGTLTPRTDFVFGPPDIGDDDKRAAAYNALNKNIRIVVARPFIEHLMHSVILTVSGRDTGATLFGPADMQLSANTQVKTIEGHYTGHFKAVITKPQNVLVMRDVACSGYVTGNNTTWFAKDGTGYSLSAAATNMMSRLSFANDAGARYGSMLAFPAFDEQFRSGQLDTVMCAAATVGPFCCSLMRALLCAQVDHHAPLALGSYLGHRRHPQLLPRRRDHVPVVLGHAQPASSALWRR